MIIGREAKRVRRAEALACIAGYAVMNDVSARQAQFSGSQWFRGKSFDTFAPLGPALVTAEEIGDAGDLALSAAVDGVVMQQDSTRHLIFDLPAIIEFISEDITPLPGATSPPAPPPGSGFSGTRR